MHTDRRSADIHVVELLDDGFNKVEFLLNYKISCSDTITSHMGLGTKHDSYNYWYSTKQCNKKQKPVGGGGGGDLSMVSIHAWLLASKYPGQDTGTPQT